MKSESPIPPTNLFDDILDPHFCKKEFLKLGIVFVDHLGDLAQYICLGTKVIQSGQLPKRIADNHSIKYENSKIYSLALEHLISSKAELPQEGILFCTQFPSLGIFINKKVGFRTKTT